MNAPALLPAQAESSALKLKWVMLRGKWVQAPHILTRTPDGQLSEQPVNNGDETCAAQL